MKEREGTKKLGLFALTMLSISAAIGSGAFTLPSVVAGEAGPGAIILAFLIVGVGVLMLCLSLGNLTKKRPDLYGLFAYAEAGFGRFGGFLAGWAYWLSAWIGNISYATVLMAALGYFFPIIGTTGNSALALIIASVILWVLVALVNHGVEAAVGMNTVITIAKVAPLILFIIAAFIAFKGGMFTSDFWGQIAVNVTETASDASASTSISPTAIGSQISGCMMVIMWSFIGVEGAVMMSDRAKTTAIAGKSTIIALFGLVLVYVLISVLPYGLMDREAIANLSQPSMAYLLQGVLGDVGVVIVQIGFIISVFGAWFTWMMLPAETTELMAERKMLPDIFTHRNAHGAPTFSLVFEGVLMQIFIVILYFAENAYTFAYSMSTPLHLIACLFVIIFQLQYTLGHRDESDFIKNLIVGIIGACFYGWVTYTVGLGYLFLSFIVFDLGFFFYYFTRKQNGDARVFSRNEWISVAVIVILSVVGITMFANGMVSM